MPETPNPALHLTAYSLQRQVSSAVGRECHLVGEQE